MAKELNGYTDSPILKKDEDALGKGIYIEFLNKWENQSMKWP